MMRNMRAKKGFTLAEVLIVVAIIAVLGALVVIAVFNYLRSMTKLEYDGYAKSIFVAAQNHLTMAEHEGYLGRTDFGTAETPVAGNDPATPSTATEGVYYFTVYSQGDSLADSDSILGLILPFGSVDETVRAGQYIIRYHKDTAQVMDVFYWSDTGRFKHSYGNEYFDFLSKRDDKSKLRTYDSDKSVIGYYGGVDAADLASTGEKLEAPLIVLTNAEKLTVTVTDPNAGNANAKLKLVIKGLSSQHTREIELDEALANVSLEGSVYTVTLDDITTAGMHFYELFCSSANSSENLIPGEDITVYAVAYNDTELTNVAYSSEQTSNSLFASINDAKDTASIANFRHLENLDKAVSRLGENASTELDITKAEQTADLDWTEFLTAVQGSGGTTPSVVPLAGSPTAPGAYYPVDAAYGLSYDGKGFSIQKVTANSSTNAGLFGCLNSGSVANLKLVDFSITGADNAGALAGLVRGGAKVENVLAIHSSGNSAAKIVSAGGNAGGLIGHIADTATTVKASAAALLVEGGGNAGGLIGLAESGTVTGCYAGGHTEGGDYNTASFNVSSAGGNAGGLIGSSAATVNYCYSTCSASGATAGGFVGTESGGSISNSYCTGLVGGTAKGAFAGKITAGTNSNDQYFSIINWGLDAVGSGSAANLSAFDETTESYRSFVGIVTAEGENQGRYSNARQSASPYDGTLVGYYQGLFNLKTVAQLGAAVASTDFVNTHYGDWPAPEIFFVNVPA